MLFTDLVDTALGLTKTRSRVAKRRTLADLLERCPAEDLATTVSFLTGTIPGGRIGVGPAVLRQLPMIEDGTGSSLPVSRVREELDAVREVSGSGSRQRRIAVLTALFGNLPSREGDFLRRLLLQELRQGALAGVMVDGIAEAFDVPRSAVRRAAMLAGDLPAIAVAASLHGLAGLEGFQIEVMRPVQPMLASPVADLEEARARSDRTLQLEHKLDGARVQVHRDGQRVRVFTRQLLDVTHAVPEVVESVLAAPCASCVLDGEAFVADQQGQPVAFQTTMRRFGRRAANDATRRELPLATRWFDLLALDGDAWIDEPLSARRDRLATLFPADQLVPALRPEDRALPELHAPSELAEPSERAEAQQHTQHTHCRVEDAFLEQALSIGCEGIMAKDPQSTYEAGSRGFSWLKIKPVHTLDLVVLAAEWGSGRRKGWLSNLHLGARDGENGGFVMLGKTFKGLTDELLRWQTEALQEIALDPQPATADSWAVHVRPELVVEIACNNIQTSPQYPGGMALRFARVKRYRPDRSPADATTIDEVRALHDRETGSATGDANAPSGHT